MALLSLEREEIKVLGKLNYHCVADDQGAASESLKQELCES